MKKALILILCLVSIFFYFQDRNNINNNPVDREPVEMEVSHDELSTDNTVKHSKTINDLKVVSKVTSGGKEIIVGVEERAIGPSDFNLNTSFETTDYYDAFLNAYSKKKYEDVILFAQNLLKIPDKYSSNFWYGNLCHATYIILGKAYLFMENIEKAESSLIKSVDNKCVEKSIDKGYSPQLMSFGPDRSLAYSLYLKGRKKAVVEFFKLTKKFWKMGLKDGTIQKAISNIETTELSYEQEDDNNFPFEPVSYTIDYSKAPMSKTR